MEKASYSAGWSPSATGATEFLGRSEWEATRQGRFTSSLLAPKQLSTSALPDFQTTPTRPDILNLHAKFSYVPTRNSSGAFLSSIRG
jgi:hypothetical protein